MTTPAAGFAFPVPRLLFTTSDRTGQPVPVWRGTGETALSYTTACELGIDYDGAAHTYHQPTTAHPKSGRPPGLDHLGNASNPIGLTPPPPGRPWVQSSWPGIAIDPVTRAPYLDAQGFYVSRTALEDTRQPLRSRTRYVDATTVPYLVMTADFRRHGGMVKGDFAAAYNQANGLLQFAIFADSRGGGIGEVSSMLVDALRTRGHRDHRITWVLFPRSARSPHPWPVSPADIAAEGRARFARWGGTPRIADLLLDDLVAAVRPLAGSADLLRILASARTALRQGAAAPAPAPSTAHPAVHPLSDIDDAIADLAEFVQQVTASAGTLGTARAQSLTAAAETIRRALEAA